MDCKNLKRRIKKSIPYMYCSIKKKIINYEDCKNCSYKEYKQYKTMKSRTNKQAKREKERFSIIYPDLTKCCVCGLKTGDYDDRIKMYTRIEKNEVYSGSYRQISINLGMITPFCIYCHKEFHSDVIMNLKYKVMFQKKYMRTHSLDEFIDTFGQDFIFKLEQKKRS